MEISKICVVGAGQMGQQIAMLSALSGFQTTLQDINQASLEKAKAGLFSLMDKWVSKGKISDTARKTAFERLVFLLDLSTAAADADFIIEAVIEKLEVKRDVFRQLDEIAPKHAIFASNSSTIVSSLLVSSTKRPDKVCNMHFFYPPLVMECIEVVINPETSEDTANTALFVCEQLNRTGLLLKKEISGFVANRILGAIHREAIELYEGGIADFETIDLICKKALAHPLGPFEIMDLSGLDVCYYVMEQQYAESGKLAEKPAACIKEKVALAQLGRKTGKGFYDYDKRYD